MLFKVLMFFVFELPILMLRFSHLSQRAHVWLLTGQSTHLSQIVTGMSCVLLISPATSKSFSSFHMLFHLQFISRLCQDRGAYESAEYENELFLKPQTCQSLPSMLIDVDFFPNMCQNATDSDSLASSVDLSFLVHLNPLVLSVLGPFAALNYFYSLCNLGVNPRIHSAPMKTNQFFCVLQVDCFSCI